MVWAQKHRADVDTFVIDTGNEPSAGSVHPVEALRAYRDARGIPAKLVVVGMTSEGSALLIPTTPACSMSSVSTHRQRRSSPTLLARSALRS